MNVSIVLFWILLILVAIGIFPPDSSWPYLGRARWVVILICVAILGWHLFGGIK